MQIMKKKGTNGVLYVLQNGKELSNVIWKEEHLSVESIATI